MSLKAMHLVGMLFMSCLFLSAGLYLHAYWQVVVSLTACMFELFGYTAIIALMSNSVTSQEQGKALGGAGAVFGLAWTVLAPMVGQVLSINVNLPLILAALCGFTTFFLMFKYQVHESSEN
jgi:hypothetical protein